MREMKSNTARVWNLKPSHTQNQSLMERNEEENSGAQALLYDNDMIHKSYPN